MRAEKESKKRNHLIALLLVLVLAVSSLAACGKKETPASGDKGNKQEMEEQETENQTPEKENEETKNPETEDDSQEQTLEGNESGLPLTEEKKELSIWLTWSNSYVSDPNELIAYKELEERTNVHLNWTYANNTEAKEKFGLLIASGDYPDIVCNASSYYTGGLSAAVDDGVFLDMTDIVAQYMPNYSRILNSDEGIRKNSTSDSGRLDTVWAYATWDGKIQGEPIWSGLAIRQDWLNKLGLEVPETIDEWHDMLVAFRDKTDCDYPMSIPGDGLGMTGGFLSAYDVMPEFYQVDGKVKFGPIEEGYKKWLDLFRSWYAEGLIDPNFPTNNVVFMTDHDTMATGKCGVGLELSGYMADVLKVQGYTQEADFFLIGAKNPTLVKGETAQSTFPGREYLDISVNLTSNCKDIELAAKWLDYMYTTDGMELINYGIEGDSYFVDEAGEYQWSEKVMKGVDGLTAMDTKNLYTLGTSTLGLYSWATNQKIRGDNDVALAMASWDLDGNDYAIHSSVTLTTEENTEFYNHYTDIETLVDEFTTKYIMGNVPESDYDSFIKNLETYGIQICIQLKQQALDRYNQR